MTGMTVMPHHTDWTVDDLDNIPDDGFQYELLDGMLLVSPAPVPLHQRVCGKLYLLLTAACPPELEVLFAPVDWQPSRRTSLQPDLLVIPRGDLDFKAVTEPLILAVEVLSPSTRRKDFLLKRAAYEEAGVLTYWMVDPEEPSITALDLVDGHYQLAGGAVADEAVSLHRPFDITITPQALISR